MGGEYCCEEGKTSIAMMVAVVSNYKDQEITEVMASRCGRRLVDRSPPKSESHGTWVPPKEGANALPMCPKHSLPGSIEKDCHHSTTEIHLKNGELLNVYFQLDLPRKWKVHILDVRCLLRT